MKRIGILLFLLMFTLTACTTTTEYTISFESNGGTNVEDIVILSGEPIPIPNNPTRDGFAFDGWYIDDTLETIYTSDIIVKESLTLYAKWIDVYSVSTVTFFDESTILEVIVIINSALSKTPQTTKEGHTFHGWYYDEALTQPYMENDELDESISLYGKWTPVTNYLYLIYGPYALGRITLEYQEEFLLEDITIRGFTFEGWYSDSELTTPVTSVIGTDDTMYVYGKYTEEVINLPVETEVDLTSLGYYSYLDSNNPVIHIHVKDIGTLSLQLFPGVAQNTVNNMISYIEAGEYQNSTFHRIISDFMIQGGIVDNTACPIEGAFSDNGIINNVSHTRGALSMARTSVMDSATSQFFIVHEDSLFLDGSYATFGGLVNGFHVLDYIATLTTSSTDAPIRDVIIDSITIDYNGYVPSERTCTN